MQVLSETPTSTSVQTAPPLQSSRMGLYLKPTKREVRRQMRRLGHTEAQVAANLRAYPGVPGKIRWCPFANFMRQAMIDYGCSPRIVVMAGGGTEPQEVKVGHVVVKLRKPIRKFIASFDSGGHTECRVADWKPN